MVAATWMTRRTGAMSTYAHQRTATYGLASEKTSPRRSLHGRVVVRGASSVDCISLRTHGCHDRIVWLGPLCRKKNARGIRNECGTVTILLYS